MLDFVFVVGDFLHGDVDPDAEVGLVGLKANQELLLVDKGRRGRRACWRLRWLLLLYL